MSNTFLKLAKIAISTTFEERDSKVEHLSKFLQLPIAPLDSNQYDYLLIQTPNHLELKKTNSKLNPLVIDFLSEKSNFRRTKGGGSGQLIAKAVGIKKQLHLKIFDLTAGLGSDAFVLACLGCDVTMIERSLVLFALLNDALIRLKQHEDFKHIKLNLINADSIDFLSNLSDQEQPDIIYLDPMFPERSKTALVKKEMRILKEVVGTDPDAQQLFNAAKNKVKKRIVVKRSKLASTISSEKPNIIYFGKSSRFDVYLPKSTVMKSK